MIFSGAGGGLTFFRLGNAALFNPNGAVSPNGGTITVKNVTADVNTSIIPITAQFVTLRCIFQIITGNFAAGSHLLINHSTWDIFGSLETQVPQTQAIQDQRSITLPALSSLQSTLPLGDIMVPVVYNAAAASLQFAYYIQNIVSVDGAGVPDNAVNIDYAYKGYWQ